MQEIADGTFNYATLNEIMPMIYKRFTEKAAEEWRQIYKALQLLEFLIKNGSERVIDDARGHLTLLKMLRQFHYIDPNGKDQGLNVRNRAKELAELLGDVDRIRAERKKARATRNKYSGAEGGMGLGGGTSSGSKYGGYGSETGGSTATGSYGGYSGGVYGDGGGFGGQTNDPSDSRGGQESYDEYNEYDEGAVKSPPKRQVDPTTSTASSKRLISRSEPPKKKEPEVDLLAFGDDDIALPPISNGKQPAANTASSNLSISQPSGGTDDDDFDDFQSATALTTSPPPLSPPPTSNQFAVPIARSAQPPNSPLGTMSLYASQSGNSTAFKPLTPQPRPTGYQTSQPNYFTSIQTLPPSNQQQPASLASLSISAKPTSNSASGVNPFASLMGGAKNSNATSQNKGLTMADMAKQKASAGLWGASAGGGGLGQQQQQQRNGAGGGDLLG